MSGISEPITTVKEYPAALSHRRILWLTAAIAVAAAIAGFVFVSQRFGSGLFVGGILSFLNYYWLKVSLKKVFEKIIGGGNSPRFLTANYFPRYLAIGAFLAIVYFTKIVPVVPVLLGLSAFAMAVVVEGLILLFLSFSKREEF